MRRLERWLREHVFKVGWLVTKKPGTTTLLFYTFFLPGVFLHEFVRWLVAGILNVRAERAIKMPDEQQIAELKLTFIRIDRRAGELRTAIISAAPLLVGLVIIGYVSQNVLNIPAAIEALGSGGADNLSRAITILTNTPDVWLWVYFLFTIANTMMPSWNSLKGGRIILIAIGVAGTLLVLLGVADEVFLNALAEPLVTTANVLTLTFAFVIGIDLLGTAVLGTIEAVIERVTGDSATFQNGKLIAMTRKERIRLQEQERQRQSRQAKAAASKRAPSGPPSIYNFPLPIPDAPGKDAQTVTVLREDPAALESGAVEGSNRLPPPVISAPNPQKSLFNNPAETDETENAAATPAPAQPLKPATPAISRPSPFASPKPPDDDEDTDEKDDKTTLGTQLPRPATPTVSRPSPFAASKPATADDDDKEEDKTVSGAQTTTAVNRPSPFASPKPATADDDEDADEKDAQPSLGSQFPRPATSPISRPSLFAATKPAGDEDDDDEKPVKPALGSQFPRPATPAVSRPSPFAPKPATNDEDADEKSVKPALGSQFPRPATSPIIRPSPFAPPKPANDEDDEDEPPSLSAVTGKPAAPALRRPFAQVDEEEDEVEDDESDSDDEEEDEANRI